jgi:hypothetical protein
MTFPGVEKEDADAHVAVELVSACRCTPSTAGKEQSNYLKKATLYLGEIIH